MVPRTTRERSLATVASEIVTLRRSGITLVAVDGVDGAGKTHFAGELEGRLQERGTAVIRASVDGFHNPPEVRYRRGRNSPEGFFRDSYNYDALCGLLLEPLRRGHRHFVRAVYDVHEEAPIDSQPVVAPDHGVLVFDGIFLHRPELRTCWDYSVFLDVDFSVSIPRGAQRGYGDSDPSAALNRRYVEGQRLYLRECHPREHADVVIDNNVLPDAAITRRSPLEGDSRLEDGSLGGLRLEREI